MTNILKALKNFLENPITDILYHYKSKNRINSTGQSLEFYIKDLFCNSVLEKDLEKKNVVYNKYFSYLGNQNNPPDIILKGGDAIEVKKIETASSALALNSSFPKDKLYAQDPMITNACRNCEQWNVKDIIYTVGVVEKQKLKSLWFVYGDCYAASAEIYKTIKSKISEGINEIEGVGFSKTNELARINKVDPLGITYLRIRNMWHIKNPLKVFEYLPIQKEDGLFTVNALMLKEKYDAFPKEDRLEIEKLSSEKLKIRDVKIKSPNNPAILLEAKLINITKDQV